MFDLASVPFDVLAFIDNKLAMIKWYKGFRINFNLHNYGTKVSMLPGRDYTLLCWLPLCSASSKDEESPSCGRLHYVSLYTGTHHRLKCLIKLRWNEGEMRIESCCCCWGCGCCGCDWCCDSGSGYGGCDTSLSLISWLLTSCTWCPHGWDVTVS